MKWVLIAIGLLTERPFVSVSEYATLQECFYTGHRLAREYNRAFLGDAEPEHSMVNISCMPSTGERPPTCGMDDLPPCPVKARLMAELHEHEVQNLSNPDRDITTVKVLNQPAVRWNGTQMEPQEFPAWQDYRDEAVAAISACDEYADQRRAAEHKAAERAADAREG